MSTSLTVHQALSYQSHPPVVPLDYVFCNPTCSVNCPLNLYLAVANRSPIPVSYFTNVPICLPHAYCLSLYQKTHLCLPALPLVEYRTSGTFSVCSYSICKHLFSSFRLYALPPARLARQMSPLLMNFSESTYSYMSLSTRVTQCPHCLCA